MKAMGLYQLLNPKTTKLFGYNIFKLGSIILIIYLILIIGMYIMSIYYSRYEITEIFKYASVLVATTFALIKICLIIRNCDAFWEFLNFTSIRFLSFSGHQRTILIRAREISMRLTTIFTVSWFAIAVVWILSPIIIKDNYINVKFNNGTFEQYRYNMLNLIFPVTGQFYNDNFLIFYFIETILLILYCFIMNIYDFLVITMCITISYQLKVITKSYSELGHRNTNNDFKSELYLV